MRFDITLAVVWLMVLSLLVNPRVRGEAPPGFDEKMDQARSFVKNKQYQQAISVLERVKRSGELNHRTPTEVRVFHYNYGKTLELAGREEAAIRAFIAAVPLAAAIDSGSKLLHDSKIPRSALAAKFEEALLRTGDVERVGAETLSFMTRWSNDPAAQSLLNVMAHYYLAASIHFADFEHEVWPRLKKATEGTRLETAADQLKAAYVGDLDTRNKKSSVGRFSAWSDGVSRDSLVLVLKMVGDQYYFEQEPGRALDRYSSAWFLDVGNTAAAFRTANLLGSKDELESDDTELISSIAGFLNQSWFDKEGKFRTPKPITTVLPWVRHAEYGDEDLYNMTLTYGLLTNAKWMAEGGHLENPSWDRAVTALADLRAQRTRITPTAKERLAEILRESGSGRAAEMYQEAGRVPVQSLEDEREQSLRKIREAIEEAQRLPRGGVPGQKK